MQVHLHLPLPMTRGFLKMWDPEQLASAAWLALKMHIITILGGTKASWNDFIIGVRGTYHLTLLKDMNNQFDTYAGVMFGFRVENFKDNYYQQSSSSVNPAAGIFVGAKYNFAEHFGVFAELGYDISVARIGINVNL
jgi:hypothetical protein